jgi:undecaprenyl-diphosphatase
VSVLESIILGILQGITEFLPVSSSGHLEIGKTILGINLDTKNSLFFTLSVHFATALSTIFVFRKKIKKIILGLFKFTNNKSFKFSLKIIFSMIPAVIIGLFFENKIALLFDQNMILVGLMLIITSIFLFVSDTSKNPVSSITYKTSIIMGIVQAIAILPGISRSGFTISSSVISGVKREKAARFSFLMVLPLIIGSMIKSIVDYEEFPNNFDFLPLILGFISAFITGVIACRWMIKIVKNSQLKYFGYYCIFTGFITFFYGFFNQ